MRASFLGAALLLAGAGVAGLAAAADIDGNGIVLNGSDTLFQVTANDVFAACSGQFADWGTQNLRYFGGGSHLGAGNMNRGLQAISPMSAALKDSEFCAPAGSVYSSPLAPVHASAGLSEGLLVGLDAVTIAANQVMSCSSTDANGLGAATMGVTNDGTGTPATNPPASCPGCVSGSYTFGDPTQPKYAGQASFDALAVLYFGLTHDGSYSCGGPVRRTLIRNWRYLFSNDCASGDATCSLGLTHAWRHGDLSGTTDALVSILNPPDGTPANGKGANVPVGIGALQFLIDAGAPGAVAKSNPFCNSPDANTVPAPTTAGGSADFADADPVRTVCVRGVDTVCEAFKNLATTGGNYVGDLGVVLPVVVPNSPVALITDMYPPATNGTCGGACGAFAAFKLNQASKYHGFICPSGQAPTGGNICYMPIGANGDPRCVSTNLSKCADFIGGKPDGRLYNRVTMVLSSQVQAVLPAFATGTYQFGVDGTLPVPRLLNGSFYRIHSVAPATHYADGVGTETGTTGVCTQRDETSQIGCLTDSDPCSIGYAGRESAQGFPGVSGNPTGQPLKGLAINGVPPFTPPGTDPDLAVRSLLAAPGAGPLYPLSRRLWFATIYGFGNLQGHELELAQCYATNSITSSAMANHGFVPAPGGVTCVDYPETRPNGTPAANVQGAGNVALGGCGSSFNTDACTQPGGMLTDVNGNLVPEAAETF